MSDLLHRIKIFVFQHSAREPQYLLLRGAQRMESFWGPLQGNIGFGEKLESAIHREVLDETGVLKPLDVIDLEMPMHVSLGDEDIIEWTYGFKTLPPCTSWSYWRMTQCLLAIFGCASRARPRSRILTVPSSRPVAMV